MHSPNIIQKLLRPLIDGDVFVVRASKPLKCKFMLTSDLCNLRWSSFVKNEDGNVPGPQQMVGGDIAIEKILGAEAVNDVVQNQKAAERRNQFSFEMKLELLTVQAQDSANDMQSKSVQLCLCATSEQQRKTWIAGIFYLRSLCPREFFQ